LDESAPESFNPVRLAAQRASGYSSAVIYWPILAMAPSDFLTVNPAAHPDNRKTNRGMSNQDEAQRLSFWLPAAGAAATMAAPWTGFVDGLVS
jgi:hypothetical protein